MAYSELIKSFARIRDYMREFYVFGFKSREEFKAKSARSYDNERRRIESWLGDYMAFRQDAAGKNVFLSVDSRQIHHNPLYKAFKAKSFTNKDITLADIILTGMGLTAVESFTTVHNYIDTDAMILRKGSVSAKAGEKLLIPINMRDGSLICVGKGNEDWNCSAPHGAGRLMSRRAAFSALSMEEFRKEMEGIYTTCVLPDTLDESPMAYKSMEEIVAQIEPTADIVEHILPVYNFKASD